MKHAFVILPVLLARMLLSTPAFAQTTEAAASAEPVPTPAAISAETPPAPTVPEGQTQAQTPVPTTSPPFTPEVRPHARSVDPSWGATPAPIWWGKSFEPPQVPSRRWYGWKTIIATSAADLITVTTALTVGFDPRVIFVGIGGHVLAGPIVHWSHGNVGRGFGVFGLNVTLTAIGMISTYAVSWPYHPAPAFVGYLVGPILDIALFSTEIDTPPAPKIRVNSSGITFGILPLIDSTRRGLLLTGQF